MKTNQYRVWDKEKKAWITENVYLAPDGTLWEEVGMDDPAELKRPRWYDNASLKRYQGRTSADYAKIGREIEDDIRRHQTEWYDIEFATGYLDKAGKMIYDGDIVHNEREEENFQVTWGDFSDCCVEGEAWVLLPECWQNVMGRWCDNDNVEGRYLTVIGNIHETPELLPQEQSA